MSCDHVMRDNEKIIMRETCLQFNDVDRLKANTGFLKTWLPQASVLCIHTTFAYGWYQSIKEAFCSRLNIKMLPVLLSAELKPLCYYVFRTFLAGRLGLHLAGYDGISSQQYKIAPPLPKTLPPSVLSYEKNSYSFWECILGKSFCSEKIPLVNSLWFHGIIFTPYCTGIWSGVLRMLLWKPNPVWVDSHHYNEWRTFRREGHLIVVGSFKNSFCTGK